jgi:putative oxidoreductase
MLTAIFLQKWPDAMEYGSSWPLLPAIGFLWISVYSIVLGSGKFGLDYLISRK